jgi:hypothetical protein
MLIAIRRGQDHMSPTQVAALGPELLPWAREYTNDLNEAHFLVHQVVNQIASDAGAENALISVDDVKALMTATAQQSGIAGLVLT